MSDAASVKLGSELTSDAAQHLPETPPPAAHGRPRADIQHLIAMLQSFPDTGHSPQLRNREMVELTVRGTKRPLEFALLTPALHPIATAAKSSFPTRLGRVA